MLAHLFVQLVVQTDATPVASTRSNFSLSVVKILSNNISLYLTILYINFEFCY